MTESAIENQAKEKTRRYLSEKLGNAPAPRITLNPDVWLQETVAILSETSIEMIRLMAEKPSQADQFIRVFSLVTHLAADSKKMLQQGGGNQPPVAPSTDISHNDGMEDRINKLEQIIEKTSDRLNSLDTRLVRVETKLDTKAEKSDLLSTELRLSTLGVIGFAAMLGILAKGFGWL